MFERFTEDARKIVKAAQEEARHLNHSWIGTEHLLLAVVNSKTKTAEYLATVGIDDAAVEVAPAGTEERHGHIPFTPKSKRCLELSLREALQLGHNYIDTGHLLLGLMREETGQAAKALTEHKLDLQEMRKTMLEGKVFPIDPVFGSSITTEIIEAGAIRIGGSTKTIRYDTSNSATRGIADQEQSGWNVAQIVPFPDGSCLVVFSRGMF